MNSKHFKSLLTVTVSFSAILLIAITSNIDRNSWSRLARSPTRSSLPPHEQAYLTAAEIIKNDLIPVLVIGCNRVAITRALEPVLRFRPNATRFPVFVSLACGVPEVKDAVLTAFAGNLTVWEYPDFPKLGTEQAERYHALAVHYQLALERIFANETFNQVIILEDDLEISPDFYSFFAVTLPLLYTDPTLFCISSWNDQGLAHLAKNTTRLLRTDFMPGLGWLLSRAVWDSLAPWTRAPYWDDWMRLPAQRRARQCVVPEVPRNRNFGKDGVSGGQFFDEFIAKAAFAGDAGLQAVEFEESWQDVAALLEPEYEYWLERDVYEEAELVGWDGTANRIDLDGLNLEGNVTRVRVEYESTEELEKILVAVGMLHDPRAGVYRSAYKGILSFRMDSNLLVYLAPTKKAE
ncbi:glycosyl transferase [Chytriomyces sp. MP71]|nr:glycosyl transferase [Chytriomyces sp. MP71]